MSGLLFLFGSALAPVRSELGNGLHVVLEPAPDAAAGLIAFAAGAIAGKHARVWLDGKDPHGDPGVRATIAGTKSYQRCRRSIGWQSAYRADQESDDRR